MIIYIYNEQNISVRRDINNLIYLLTKTNNYTRFFISLENHTAYRRENKYLLFSEHSHVCNIFYILE